MKTKLGIIPRVGVGVGVVVVVGVGVGVVGGGLIHAARSA
jgi:hypothetical protein